MPKKFFLAILLISSTQQSNAMLSRIIPAAPIAAIALTAVVTETALNTIACKVLEQFGSPQTKSTLQTLKTPVKK